MHHRGLHALLGDHDLLDPDPERRARFSAQAGMLPVVNEARQV